jgi:hypothetical protein
MLAKHILTELGQRLGCHYLPYIWCLKLTWGATSRHTNALAAYTEGATSYTRSGAETKILMPLVFIRCRFLDMARYNQDFVESQFPKMSDSLEVSLQGRRT